MLSDEHEPQGSGAATVPGHLTIYLAVPASARDAVDAAFIVRAA